MSNLRYVLRGGRDFYDVTEEELQEGCDILAGFFQGSSEFVATLVDPYSEDDDEKRIQMPFFLSNYYDTMARLERLRQNIAARKEASRKEDSKE